MEQDYTQQHLVIGTQPLMVYNTPEISNQKQDAAPTDGNLEQCIVLQAFMD
jgi:hypothetical protein